MTRFVVANPFPSNLSFFEGVSEVMKVVNAKVNEVDINPFFDLSIYSEIEGIDYLSTFKVLDWGHAASDEGNLGYVILLEDFSEHKHELHINLGTQLFTIVSLPKVEVHAFVCTGSCEEEKPYIVIPTKKDLQYFEEIQSILSDLLEVANDFDNDNEYVITIKDTDGSNYDLELFSWISTKKGKFTFVFTDAENQFYTVEINDDKINFREISEEKAAKLLSKY